MTPVNHLPKLWKAKHESDQYDRWIRSSLIISHHWLLILPRSNSIYNALVDAAQDEVVGGRWVRAALEDRGHVVPVQAWEYEDLGPKDRYKIIVLCARDC